MNADNTHVRVDEIGNTAVEANHDEQRHKDSEGEEDGNVMYMVQILVSAHPTVTRWVKMR